MKVDKVMWNRIMKELWEGGSDCGNITDSLPTLFTVCKHQELGFPKYRQVIASFREHPEWEEEYEEYRKARVEAFLDQMLDISFRDIDESDEVAIIQCKLKTRDQKINSIKYMAEKMKPIKYGNKSKDDIGSEANPVIHEIRRVIVDPKETE